MKTTLALFFGNRGFFPESLIESAIEEMSAAVKAAGAQVLVAPAQMTRYNAVETAEEGRKYAAFLKEHEGKYDGVVLCMPNFSDETGAYTALKNCGVPILIQAYPDELGKMNPANRRDAFCGKFSIMDVFYQAQLPFTAYSPHVCSPKSTAFQAHIDSFISVCNVVKHMKSFTMLSIGARTTAFKTLRYDEIALERVGITTETLDLSSVLAKIEALSESDDRFKRKKETFLDYTNWSSMPERSFVNLVKTSVIMDQLLDEYNTNCMTLRCWDEFEQRLGIAPCVVLSELNHRGIVASCEMDAMNAIAMRALSYATGNAAACLDWNNNYGEDEDKCILFHCGPVAQSMMAGKGLVKEHMMFKKSFGDDFGWGTNEGRIRPMQITLCSATTEDGKVRLYAEQGEITPDPIDKEFFGCAGVCFMKDMQKKLLYMGTNGFRHHVSISEGNRKAVIEEALGKYLGYDILSM